MTQLAKLEARLALYETALEKALIAQSYGIKGMTKQMASVESLQKQIDILTALIAREKGGGSLCVRPAFIPSRR